MSLNEQVVTRIEQLVREIIVSDIEPAIRMDVEGIVREQLVETVRYVMRHEINQPWRWRFRIGRSEIALRRVSR